MEKNVKYSEHTAIRRLIRNGISVKSRTIYTVSAGLKLLGAIDYLVNICEYIWIREESKSKSRGEEDDN